jgi:polysaccharide biosynthesis protein PslG
MRSFMSLALLAALVFLGVASGPAIASAQGPQAADTSSPIPSSYFGMMINRRNLPWPTALGVPLGSLRLWDTYTRWQDLNPSSGKYTWTNLDSWLESAKTNGVTDIMFSITGTPRWISSGPNDTECDYAGQVPGGCDHPKDLDLDGTGSNQAWRDFIFNLATHINSLNFSTYSKPAYFEVWNEFTRMVKAPYAWRGSHTQMVRLSQDAMCILTGRGTITATGEACNAASMHVKAVGLMPNAIILAPNAGLRGEWGRHQSYFSTPGAAEGADVLTIHPYAQVGRCCVKAEENIPLQMTSMRGMPRNALALPLWVTEGSWGMENSLPDADLQAAYVARTYLVSWSLGARRYYWDGWNLANLYGALWYQNGVHGCDDGGSGKGCVNKAGTAYAQTYQWMVGNTMTTPCRGPVPPATGVWTCGLTKPDGTQLLAVWDSGQSCSGTCNYSNYAPDAKYKAYYTLDSPTQHPINGRSIPIGAKPIMLEAPSR